VLGSATPQIRRSTVVEDGLLGQVPGHELYRSAARLAADEMARLAGRRWSSEYKEPALMAMTARALACVFDGMDEENTNACTRGAAPGGTNWTNHTNFP
jgi:CO/xanthine dehydrogenase FAD-binding subunit